MPQLSFLEPLLTPIERPRCPNCQTRMMKALRRLFIAASRISAHAFARQSWPGLELFVIALPYRKIELERTATRPRHRTARPWGVNARLRESDFATVRQLLLSLWG